MIRAGINKPKLYFHAAHNDMSHFTPGHWSVNNYFIMSLDEFVEKYQFSHFDMNPQHISKEELKILTDKMLRGEEITYLDSPWAYRMNQLIKKSFGQVWEFNAINHDLNGYIRGVVGLGDKSLTRWSWYDAYVVLPILTLTARVLNFLRRPKMRKELAAWDKFLERLYNK